uniref:Uncharacterized protein n=1 Tax=viral metagenome TaxID=1070528 RepID=A0A6C0E2S0_9ZZZZ
MFIQTLVVLFVALISYQLFLACSKNSLIEGMESTSTSPEFAPYDTSNPANALILSQQNAGNINYLKQRLDEMGSIKTTVDSLSQQVDQLNQQMAGLVQQQSDLGQQLAGTTPPTITGTS